jgi:hypothetical protein
MANLAGINRATKKGFTAYMMTNPFYFREQFDLPATPQNIVKGFAEAMRLRKTPPSFPTHLDDNETGIVFHNGR